MSVIRSESSASTCVQPGALFVDLDLTLSASDLLVDGIVQAIKRNPLNAIRMVGWMMRGRAYFKRQVARTVTPDVVHLPYRETVLAYLREERAKAGRVLVLATASDEIWARQVADEVGLFDDILASDGKVNLKGRAKLEAIDSFCARKGISSFDYIGDSCSDSSIWERARTPLAVDTRSSNLRELSREECGRFKPKRLPSLGAVAKAMRPHQWVKNLLLLTPLMLSHQATNPAKLFACIAAMASFSLCASSVYVINDMLDTEADRRHPRKRLRPFASGRLPLIFGPFLSLALAAAGFAIAVFLLPPDFQWMLVGYLVITTLYSFWLKSKLMIDIVVLAILYTVRIIAGGLAAEVLVTEWMMAFSMFIFTSLAFAKRYSELERLNRSGGQTGNTGRGYFPKDLEMLGAMGPASGYLAVLVLALYLNSQDVRGLYANGQVLWLLCPLMLFWIGRLWIKVGRGHLTDDPVAFAVTDRVSWVVALLAGALVVLAI